MNNNCNDVYKMTICFSHKGRKVIERLNSAALGAGVSAFEKYVCFDDESGPENDYVRIELDDFTKKGFGEHRAMIFVGAVGIAVRAISGYVKDKLTDSLVIIIDDNGQFVIPILSGHAGGANKLAIVIAELIGAFPVITTSTDVNSAFSADVFAVENNLSIRNREGIKKVSAKAIEGKPITISIKDYPPVGLVDIILANETDREYDLLLSPKKYTVGIGTKKGKDPKEAEAYILEILAKEQIDVRDVYAVCTVDIKEEEPAVKDFSRKYRIPLITFEASVLERAKGDFSGSEFVKETVGVDNVCERAAVLGAGPGGMIVRRKTKGDGIAVAIARRPLDKEC